MVQTAHIDDEHAAVDVLVATVSDRLVAFRLGDVEQVLPAAAVAELPHAPAVVRGLLNLRGAPLPVIDLRVRLGLEGRAAHPDDHVLVCQVGGRSVGVWVDHAAAVRRLERTVVVPFDDGMPARHFAGAAMVGDGVLLVSDVDSFLSAAETLELERALSEVAKDRRGV